LMTAAVYLEQGSKQQRMEFWQELVTAYVHYCQWLCRWGMHEREIITQRL